jgi:hypothetical protein
MRIDRIFLGGHAAMTRILTALQPRRALGLIGLAVLLHGCTKDLLKVVDPDIVLDDALKASTAAGAFALHQGAILRLTEATAGTQQPDALFAFGGLLTDEWKSGDTFIQRNTMDQRIWDPKNTFNAGPFRNLNRVRVLADAAIEALRTYRPDPATDVARMFAFIAYVETLIAEHYCNGTPISDVVGTEVVPGDPISNDSMLALAIANTDSAFANLGGGDSTRVHWLAQVVRGRALLSRGRPDPATAAAAAAAAVAGVPDSFQYAVEYSEVSVENQIWALNSSARRYTVGDREGMNGLDYRSARSITSVGDTIAGDPRIPTKRGPQRIFDTAFPEQVVRQGVWGKETPVKIVTGIEARLIEAEAALRTGDAVTWLAKLNQLRANGQLYPKHGDPDTLYLPKEGTILAPLTDPDTASARENLLFRERAFWMFGTGHRLGDMRRLVRQYGRAAETVFPTGPWFKGGNYGDAVQMSVPFDEQNNPKFVQCTDRNP